VGFKVFAAENFLNYEEYFPKSSEGITTLAWWIDC